MLLYCFSWSPVKFPPSLLLLLNFDCFTLEGGSVFPWIPLGRCPPMCCVSFTIFCVWWVAQWLPMTDYPPIQGTTMNTSNSCLSSLHMRYFIIYLQPGLLKVQLRVLFCGIFIHDMKWSTVQKTNSKQPQECTATIVPNSGTTRLKRTKLLPRLLFS